MVYPAALWGAGEVSPKPADISNFLSGQVVMAGRDLIFSQESLLHVLQNVFRSALTMSIISSLIARSNEVQGGTAPELEVETQETGNGSPEPKPSVSDSPAD
jgi:hypothetical protein